MAILNDPQFIDRVSRYFREDLHSGLYTGGVKYNDKGRQFFAENPEAEAPEILEFLQALRSLIP